MVASRDPRADITSGGTSVIARLPAGTPEDQAELGSLPDPWAGLARKVVAANGRGRLATFDDEIAGLFVPRAIVLPWIAEVDVWQIKVRRPDPLRPKYTAVGGGHPRC